MKNIMNCMREFDFALFSGVKTPHGLSFPVFRYQNGKYSTAVFAYYMKMENIRNGKLPRPSKWLVADLATGEIESVYVCEEQDFSKEPLDGVYDMNTFLSGEKPTKDQVEKLYAAFDKIRTAYAMGVNIADGVEQYLKDLLEVVPVEYGCFYEELSNVQ